MTLLTNRTFIGFVLALVVLIGGGALLVLQPGLREFITQTWTALLFGGGGWFVAKSNGSGSYGNGTGSGGR